MHFRQERLADSERSYGVLRGSLEEAVASGGEAAVEAARLQVEVSRTSEDCLGLLRKAGAAAAARLGEVAAERDSLEREVSRLGEVLEGHRGEAARREAESLRLRGVLSDIEEDHAAGKRTVAELRQSSSEILGIGADLGQKFIAVVCERDDALLRLEVSEGSLAASAADRRRLEKETVALRARVEEMAEEEDASRSEIDELRKVGREGGGREERGGRGFVFER